MSASTIGIVPQVPTFSIAHLRLAAAELLFRVKKNLQAVELLDEGLARSPGEPQATQMKLRICFEGQMWACAADAMNWPTWRAPTALPIR